MKAEIFRLGLSEIPLTCRVALSVSRAAAGEGEEEEEEEREEEEEDAGKFLSKLVSDNG